MNLRVPLGWMALVASAVCVCTGAFLAANYAPTWADAQPSVARIQNDLPLGWLLRGLHHWGGGAAIVLAALDILRQFFRGEYGRPLHAPWMSAAGLLLVVIGFGYTGYLLAGDERAYAGTLILEGVARSTPLVGEHAGDFAIGGEAISSATLTRLFAVHAAFLPMALLLLLVQRLRAEGWRLRDAVRENAVAGCGLLAVLTLLAFLCAPGIGERATLGAPPASNAQPEWFFLWVNELLHRFDRGTFLIGAVLPGVLVAGMLFLPWFASTSRRKLELTIGTLALGAILALSTMAANRAAPPDQESDAAVEEEEVGAEPVPGLPAGVDAETEEKIAKTLRRFRCTQCHQIDGDEDGGEDGPALPRHEDFKELYTRVFFRRKISDPVGFWADTGMTYPKNRKPTDEQLALLETYFFGPK